MIGKILFILLAGSTITGLTGCGSGSGSFVAQVPTTGPIEAGQLVSNTSADQFIRVIARPPRAGMSPTEIVQGFLESSASFDRNHAVARSYLTPEAAGEWNPSSGVIVYDGVPTLVEAGAAVLFSSTLSGRISDNGRYTVEDPGSQLQRSFFLTQRDGEWRISLAPAGLLLSDFDVSRAYRSFPLYFFNPSFQTLVPDARLIPVIGPALGTTLIQRLIAGPNEWLRPAVRTGIPAGVGLAVDAVPIENGVARVNLNASVTLANDPVRVALSQQIVWTLRALPEVQFVEISVNGTPLSVPGATSPQSRDAWPQVDPGGLARDAVGYAATSAGVVRLTPGGNFAVPGAFGSLEESLSKFAISADGKRTIALTAAGELLGGGLLVGAPVVSIELGSQIPVELRSIAFDGNTTAWIVNQNGVTQTLMATGKTFDIEVNGLAEGDLVQSVVPSRDGTRAAVIVSNDSGLVLLLMRVSRPSPANVTRIELQKPMRVESKLGEVTALAWSSANTIAAIASETAGTIQIYEIDLGRGEIAAQGSPAGPISIAAAPGLATLVASADGSIYENSTQSWIERIQGTTATYPG
ncbi:MAG: GerMN domain-containing protein [Actinomycetia bacterium]|nr:GerMN domain-containing protein [Actinomycetes bacterium]